MTAKHQRLIDRWGLLFYVAPVLVYLVVLFWLASIRTGYTIPQDFIAKDKFNHFSAFGLLALLVLRGIRYKFAAMSLRPMVAASVVTSSVIGALLEVWQLQFPYRSADVLDWVADTLGALLAGVAGFLWISWRARRVAISAPKE